MYIVCITESFALNSQKLYNEMSSKIRIFVQFRIVIWTFEY